MNREKPLVKSKEAELHHPNRYRVHRGEPGGNIITEFGDGRPFLNSTFVGLGRGRFPREGEEDGN